MLACVVFRTRIYGINSNRHAPFLLITNSFTIYYKELNNFSLDTSEFTIIEGDNKFLKDLFNALVDSFSVKAKHYLWGNDRNSISFFYSYFSVYISYHPYESVSITYELNRNLWP